jgi:hypothetical protein
MVSMTTIDSLVLVVPILAADPILVAVAAFRLAADPTQVVVAVPILAVVASHPAAVPIPAAGAYLRLM